MHAKGVMAANHKNVSTGRSVDALGLVGAVALASWNLWRGNYWEAGFSLILLTIAVTIARSADLNLPSKRRVLGVLNALLIACALASIWQTGGH